MLIINIINYLFDMIMFNVYDIFFIVFYICGKKYYFVIIIKFNYFFIYIYKNCF